MIYMTKTNFIKGIVIKKLNYQEYHEILHIFTEDGNIESFFYENINKNKKKFKVYVPTLVNIIYIKTSGMNKITNLEIDTYYTHVLNDIVKTSYLSNIVEIFSILQYLNKQYYDLLIQYLEYINKKDTDERLSTIYVLLKILNSEGFKFRYIKTSKTYEGYSFSKNMFVDFIEQDKRMYKLNNRLVKLIYYLSIKSMEQLNEFVIDKHENIAIFKFLITILSEYIGITTKSYNKIVELEELQDTFERNIK